MSDAFEGFLAAHDQYLAIVEHAYRTGETGAILSMLGPDYHGYYGMPDQDRADYFDTTVAIQGMGRLGPTPARASDKWWALHSLVSTSRVRQTSQRRYLNHVR